MDNPIPFMPLQKFMTFPTIKQKNIIKYLIEILITFLVDLFSFYVLWFLVKFYSFLTWEKLNF